MTARPVVVISIYDDFDSPYYAGGGPVVVRNIARRLSGEDEVVVVTAASRWRRSRRDGIRHLHLPVTWAGPRLGQVLWGVLLPVVSAFLRYDVWIESFTPPFSSSMIPLATRRPVIGLAQALSGREMARRYRTTAPLRIERLLLGRYRDIVVLNPRDQDHVASCAPRARVHLVPNAIDPPPRPPTDAAAGRYVLYLGRIDMTQKGLDLLLDAYQRAGAELLPLVVAGGGREEDQEAMRAAMEAVGPRARWCGSVAGQAKEDLLQGCAFVVVPSREESFSLVALEALSRGRPVVHFDLPQLDWIPADCGIAVPSFDVEALRASMARLSCDPELRSAAGRRAAAFAAARVGLDKLDSYVDLVRDVLSARPGPAPARGR